MLDPGWIDAHADDFDVFHVHFGFDALEPADLERIVDSLRRLGKPLVYTVHDLRNPHHVDRSAHDDALDVLVPAADELITLTPGAAAEVTARWDRRAVVLPHPHVTDRSWLVRPRPERDRPRVGLHLKSLRANLDPLPMLAILAEEAPGRGYELVVDVHTDVVVPGMRNYDAEVADVLADIERRPGVRVHVHDFYSDDELWHYLAGLDLSVLPYRFGTHSGWLEACHDLGTRVLAPRTGYYHEQHDGVLGYDRAGDAPAREDVGLALDAALDPAPWRAGAAERFAQRADLAAAHRATYESAIAAVRA